MTKHKFGFLLTMAVCLGLLPAQLVQAEEHRPPGLMADAVVVINEESFPDDSFRSYVLTLPGAEDEQLTPEELADITEIDCSARDIQSLQGIERFPALKLLWCEENQLTALDVSRNTALEDLNCRWNQLTSLDICKNTALDSLSCSWNELTALDISQNTALTYLDCSYSQLTGLDVSQNTALSDLYCNDNELTSLDVSKNPALIRLYCSCNQLESLNVGANPALTELCCADNDLASLDISRNTALQWLDCGSNGLTALDVTYNSALTHLDCSGNFCILPDGARIHEWMPSFDSENASQITGGSFDGGRVHFSADQLTYTYAFANGDAETFTLEKQPGNYIYSRGRKSLAFCEQPSTLLIASYDESGRMLDCTLHEIPANPEGVPFMLDGNAKAFLLDKNNISLCEARSGSGLT